MQREQIITGNQRKNALHVSAYGAALASAIALSGATSIAQSVSKLPGGLGAKHASALGRTIDVIVKFRHQPSESEISKLRKLGFSLTRHLSIIDSVAGSVKADRLRQIVALDEVALVSDDTSVNKTDAFTVNSSMAGAAYTQYGSLGTGIGVAVLDSGVANVPDFGALPGAKPGARLSANVDFTGLGPADQCGHGTHVAGIIGGDGAQSTGKQFLQTFYGVAPGASLINVRVLNQQGSGSVSNVIAGIQWCVTNASKYNIRVLNISLGHPVTQSYTLDPLCQAVEAAWKAGIVVVCAAGNDGRLNAAPTAGQPNGGYGTAYGSIECPGNDPYVITVGATKSVDGVRADDQIATYSGRGPTAGDLVLKPDIIAPGNHVISTEDPGNSYLIKTYGSNVEISNSLYQTKSGGYSAQYFMLSGTSMATPVVSGAVAMMLQLQPKLSPDTVKARLMLTADKWLQPDGTADAATFGAGYLNVQQALASTVVLTSPALSPTLVQPAVGVWYVNAYSALYGQGVIWDSTFGQLKSIYGFRATWGTGFDQLNATQTMRGLGLYTLSATSVAKTSGIDCTSSSLLLKGE